MRTHPDFLSRCVLVGAMCALLTSISAAASGADRGSGQFGMEELDLVVVAIPELPGLAQNATEANLAKRWAELFIYVLDEFRADDRDPTANLEGDFSTREIRIRGVVGDGAIWAGRILTEEELATADLRVIARDLYNASNPVKRWAQLFAYVLDEFKADKRDPTANIEGDFSTREIRIRSPRADRETWAGRNLTEQELATSDLRSLARELYSAARDVRRH